MVTIKKTYVDWDKIGGILAIGLALVLPLSTAMTNVMIFGMILCWIWGGNYQAKFDYMKQHPLTVWLCGFVMLSFASSFYSLADKKQIADGLTDALRISFIPFLFHFYRNQRVATLAKVFFVVAMVCTLVFAILKLYADFPIGLKYPQGAIFKSHIKTSYFMAVAVFLLIYYLKNNTNKIIYFMPLILMMVYYLLFMSVGRIGYLMLALGILMWTFHWKRYKGLAIGLCSVLALMFVAYQCSDVFSNRIKLLSQDIDFYQQGGRLLESSLGSRIQFVDTSIELIKQKPILGWGVGSYGLAYNQQHANEKILLTDNPHNEYMRVGVELGLLGLAMLLMLFYRQWYLTKYLPDELRQPGQLILLSFILGCCLNSWLMDFTEGYFYCLITAIYFSGLNYQSTASSCTKLVHRYQ